jgi:hypothetical protein
MTQVLATSLALPGDGVGRPWLMPHTGEPISEGPPQRDIRRVAAKWTHMSIERSQSAEAGTAALFHKETLHICGARDAHGDYGAVLKLLIHDVDHLL